MPASAPYIRAGALRLRAALQSRSETPDGGGGVSVTWNTEKDIWCRIRPLAGRERLEAMREESAITHEIHARYDASIIADKRILHGGIAYNIRSVMDPETKHEVLRILAESGVAT